MDLAGVCKARTAIALCDLRNYLCSALAWCGKVGRVVCHARALTGRSVKMQIETSRARSGRYVYLVCHFGNSFLEMNFSGGPQNARDTNTHSLTSLFARRRLVCFSRCTSMPTRTPFSLIRHSSKLPPKAAFAVCWRNRMGHRSPQETGVYLHVLPERPQAAVHTLPISLVPGLKSPKLPTENSPRNG